MTLPHAGVPAAGSPTRTEPCLLCRGSITADPADPFAAVLEHVRSDRHRMAQGGLTWLCPDCRAVTIPVQRDRCHGCTRSAKLVAAIPAAREEDAMSRGAISPIPMRRRHVTTVPGALIAVPGTITPGGR